MGLYEGALLLGSVNGGDILEIGTAGSGATSWVGDFEVDDYVVVRVVAFDKLKRNAPISSSPFISEHMDETILLTSPENTSVTINGSLATISWTYPSGALGSEGVEIYRGPTLEFDEATLILSTEEETTSVSYTHLTLPTILLV